LPPAGSCARFSVIHPRKEYFLQVFVRDNNIDQALRALKKKMQREGVFRELKRRRAYEKPSEKRARERSESIRRRKKLERKQAQRDGLLPKARRNGRR
jgi:small subunit ribosomal protein S21